MAEKIIYQVVEQLRTMPDNLQQEVLSFTQRLGKAKVVGNSGKALLEFAGTISQDDLELMNLAIVEDCGQVDPSEW
ncbi:MAG: hypothetical protein R3C62_19565 [Chloroflexota bacterium]